MSDTEIPPPLVLARLSRAAPFELRIEPGSAARDALRADLELLDLRKLRLEGRLVPEGAKDWRLEATLGATAVQPCAITLAPVTTRIDVAVTRRYLDDFVEPDEAEAEMPEDETAEPLPASLDLGEVIHESLALALPDFPRAEGAELGETVFAEPGVTPLSDESVKPFAGLAALKDSLKK
ncbi:DUF177 domain-containing protein [Tropicimonas sp. IMCC6043]|uniref:YceD family protein n=1 Tax=Tropicimonas sp. IMCC6043 TaxID=2510645 RepID=UPI001A9384C0|nr:DUF177 domain-containing protein [Tropicimonas sp. IMCC6043]